MNIQIKYTNGTEIVVNELELFDKLAEIFPPNFIDIKQILGDLEQGFEIGLNKNYIKKVD